LYRGGYSLIAIALALIVNRSLKADGVTAPLRSRPIAYIGTVSYGIYLYHFPIHLFVVREFQGQSVNTYAVISLVITLIVATASYYFVEAPIRSAVAKRTGNRSRPRGSPGAARRRPPGHGSVLG
jgi:peptidoglycan/LPS O-acetylase OafA/YrhL